MAPCADNSLMTFETAFSFPGIGWGTEDHGVARQDRDLFVQMCRHTGQCCHGLALASGGDQDKLLAGVVFHLLHIDQGIFRDIDVAQLLRDGDDVDHTAAFDDNFTAVFISRVDDLLHTVDVRCEGCDDDSGILMLGKQTGRSSFLRSARTW